MTHRALSVGLPFDRFAFPILDRRSADYFVDALCLARNTRERIWCQLLERVPGELRLRLLRERAGSSLAHWPAGLAGDTERWLADLLQQDGAVRDAVAPCSGRILMARSGRQARSAGVVFLVSSSATRPGAVLKVAPRGPLGAAVLREARALRMLGRTLPPHLLRTIPQVLAVRSSRDRHAVLLTGLPGRAAYVDLHRDFTPKKRVAAHFRCAAEWLAQFHGATRRPDRPVRPDELQGIVARAAASAPGQAAPQPAWLASLRASCAMARLVPVARHGDFWARNLMLPTPGDPCESGTAAGVVDWERFARRALPSDDLFHFPLTYGLAFPWTRYRRADPLTAFRRTFLEHNDVSTHVALYFERYCAGTGLDPDLLGPLFHLYLAAQSARAGGPHADRVAPWAEFGRMLDASRASVVNGLGRRS